MNAFLEMCGKVLCVILGLGAIAGSALFVYLAAYMQRMDNEKRREKP